MMYEKIMIHLSVMLCVKFLSVQYIYFSEIVHVLKAVAILISGHLNLSTMFVVSHLLIAYKVSPEWRLNLFFGTQKKYPFPLNRGVPSIEVKNIKIMWTFIREKILSPLITEVPLE